MRLEALTQKYRRSGTKDIDDSQATGGDAVERYTKNLNFVAALSDGIDHFVKVSRSYWPGLFACYDMEAVPRTNNDLDHASGRHHERPGRRGSCGVGAVAVRVGDASRAAAVPTRFRRRL